MATPDEVRANLLKVGDRVEHKRKRLWRGTVIEVRKLVLVSWDWRWSQPSHGGWYRPDSLQRIGGKDE